MQAALLLVMSTLPVVVIMLYINKRDAEKEPPKLLFKLFALGILSAFIAAIVSSIVCSLFDDILVEGSAAHLILTYFIGVGLIEELSKWFFSYRFGYKDRNCNEPFDPLIYCIFVSLGFAFIENVMYVFDQSSLNEALMVAGMRGIAAVPGHASDAAFMGFFLMQAWKCQQKGDRAGEKRNTILSILAPTVSHALYDISCELAVISETIWIIAVIGVYVIMIRSVSKSATSSKEWMATNPVIQPAGNATTPVQAGQVPFPQNPQYPQQQTTTGFPGTQGQQPVSTWPATGQGASHTTNPAETKAAPKFCGNCGSPVSSGANFCSHCGNKL